MGMCVATERRSAARWRQAALMVTLLSLASCADDLQRYYDSKLPFDTPIDWWHQLQGGAIAEERPPPPGVGDPYPNLAEIPKRPTPPDAPTRVALTARLAGERDRADYVVDFLEVTIVHYHWPDFNIADSAIVCGACLLLLEIFRRQPAE